MLRDPEQARLLKKCKPDYTDAMAQLCKDLMLSDPNLEYRFCPDRLWRFDFAWPMYKIAVEVDGGILNGGRHTSSISGRLRDIEKFNTAASMGWLVLIATTLQRPILTKIKFTKTKYRSNVLPWLSLDDPAFRELLSAALASRNGLAKMEI